jgi:hypothetical protein
MKTKILFLIFAITALTLIAGQTAKAADPLGCCLYISSKTGQPVPQPGVHLSYCQTYSSTTSWTFYAGDTSQNCSNSAGAAPVTGSLAQNQAQAAAASQTGCCVYKSNNGTGPWLQITNYTQNSCNTYTAGNQFFAGDNNCLSAGASALTGNQCCVVANGCVQSKNQAECTSLGGTLQGSADCSDVPAATCSNQTPTTGVIMNNGANSANNGSNNNSSSSTPAPTASSNSGAATVSGTTSTITFPNPLQYNTVQDLLTQGLLPALQGIIVVLAIIFIIIGGIMYITSGGNDKRMGTAKACITAAMIGLALAIAAPSFLKEIATVLNWSGALGMGGMTISQIALRVLNFLLGIVGVLAIIMLVVGGAMYLTSAGDEDRIDVAKKIILYSIIGIAVSLASLVIVKQIAALLTA